MNLVLVATLALAFGTWALSPQPAAAPPIEAALIGPKGDAIGKITLRGGADLTVVRIAINAGGLTPGWHGIHFHAVGDCSDTGQFQLSKGHVNHDSSKHGLLNPEGPDDGDLPNIYANADGSANAEVVHDLALSGERGPARRGRLRPRVHASEDDTLDPTDRNAGARVGCAVHQVAQSSRSPPQCGGGSVYARTLERRRVPPEASKALATMAAALEAGLGIHPLGGGPGRGSGRAGTWSGP
jgi:Cu-Zn family superoxide dismutase